MALGVLILWCLRAIWVIILEQRQYSGTYAHACFLSRTPLYAFPPLFLLLVLPFWASSPHKWCTCCLSPTWNGPCVNFELSLLWALLRRQGLGSTACLTGHDPKGGWGGGRPLYGPQNGSTEQWVLWASEVICRTQLNLPCGACGAPAARTKRSLCLMTLPPALPSYTQSMSHCVAHAAFLSHSPRPHVLNLPELQPLCLSECHEGPCPHGLPS